MPTVELVDLPGLQQSPARGAHISKQVVNRFLKRGDPETLVLCVIAAHSGLPLEDSTAVMKVRECDHNASTIVVLTKADKVDHQLTDPDELETQLFVPLLRGLGRPGLEWLHSMGGCVAVCNRKQDNTVSLIEQRKVEAALFQGMLARATGEFATDERKQQLSQNMGSKQLIMQMAAMYRRHIVTTWVPRAKQDAERLRDQIGTQMSNLGPHPDQMPITELLAAIQTKVSFPLCVKTCCGHLSLICLDAPFVSTKLQVQVHVQCCMTCQTLC